MEISIINMLRSTNDYVGNIKEDMDNISREIEAIRKNQKEILQPP